MIGETLKIALWETSKKSPTKLPKQISCQVDDTWDSQLCHKTNKGCVTLSPLPFTLKIVLREKKNYGNSNVSPCKNIIFKKSSKRNKKTFKIL
jgi:hypothetical protein